MGKLYLKIPFGRPKRKLESNIEIDIKTSMRELILCACRSAST